jgi:uncharacterized protein
VRPYSQRRSSEIIAAARVYGFDSGFAAFHRGIGALRNEDRGWLWEHYVLNELTSRCPGVEVRYWRDKRGHEVDFVVLKRGAKPIAIECKWSADAFDSAGLVSFRNAYPDGPSFVVAPAVERRRKREIRGHYVETIALEKLVEAVERHK